MPGGATSGSDSGHSPPEHDTRDDLRGAGPLPTSAFAAERAYDATPSFGKIRAAVIDARIRRHGDLVPHPAAAWSAQVPQTDDLERSLFLTQLATIMDGRQRRIGEHAAASSLPWAVVALGTVPDDQIPPSPWILERLASRNLDHEAAD